MICKEAVIVLTPEEVHSPEPLSLKLIVKEGDKVLVDYTFEIPKGEESEDK